jgi:uncharacterized lipoprotein YmbA
MRHLVAIPTLCALVALAAGCASTPASRFYTLSAAPTPAAASSDLSVVVGPLSVPAVVDRPQIVVRVGPNQVRPDEFNRWASPLQNNIARVVAENLVAMLGTPRVTLSSQTVNAEAEYRAAIEVQRFESALGETAMLDAVWTVSRAKDDKSRTGRDQLRRARRRTQSRHRAAQPGHCGRGASARSLRAVAGAGTLNDRSSCSETMPEIPMNRGERR